MDAMTLARNLIRVGRVNSRNLNNGTVEVIFPDKDNLVSSPLPVLESVTFPSVNDQVLCVFQGNALEQGYCLGRFYSRENPPQQLGGGS
ncbi:hypothetical protein [Bacillus solitudinis]|uniref:hypothetical protein n=1 Tax=Bacillus solitudinis TaxID=2014074 RepID=UPI000C23D26F|nr:hypothetical protein [Bacillus solitudinis]